VQSLTYQATNKPGCGMVAASAGSSDAKSAGFMIQVATEKPDEPPSAYSLSGGIHVAIPEESMTWLNPVACPHHGPTDVYFVFDPAKGTGPRLPGEFPSGATEQQWDYTERSAPDLAGNEYIWDMQFIY
jgi:hypothetical protein